jgi:SAP domain-containing ribonucleoprotein
MATDYSKKTNAELVEILKARSLPHTGKKADMVTRLQQADETKPADAVAPASTTAAEDVIDWDDEPTEPVQPSTETGAAALAAGGQGAVPNPVAVPNQKLDENPATTDDLKVESTGAAPEAAAQAEAPVEAKPAVDYTRGLPTTDLEAELAKRKARAEKFGIVEDEETALKEATKQLERAKRFGTGAEAETGVSRLDQALPDARPRKRQNESREGGRGGKRRDTGRNRGRRDGNRDGNRGDGNRDGNRRDGNKTNAGVKKPNAGNTQNKPSEKDIAALEARKKRFAAAA